MAEYIVEIDHPELCVEYGGTNFTDRLERIVRCKDCKNFDRSNSLLHMNGRCFSERFFDSPVKPDGFCAWPSPKEAAE